MLYDSIVDLIGHTPLVRLKVPAPEGVEVLAKLELQNPFGMKDRVAANAVLQARRIGALREGDSIVESSSGTMALGLGLVGRALGHPVHIVTDPRIDPITLAKLTSLGCEVHIVSAMSGKGWQSARLEMLEKILVDLPGAFWPQQYSNPDNPGAYRRLAEEITEDVGRVDVLIGSVGSGGSLCGTARVLRAVLPELRVIAVDCVGSALFDQPDVPQRMQSGLGNSLLPYNLDRRLLDEVHWLNDREAFEAARTLVAEQQIFGGNTSGSVYRVLCETAAKSSPGTRIVGIFPDRGDRYAETVYSDSHWAETGLKSMAVAESSELVEYGTPVRSWSRADIRLPENLPQRVLFIESNTTGSGMQALRSAIRMGLTPVLLSADPERYAGVDETGCEILRCATNSTAQLRAAVQTAIRREELVGVTTTSDFYVQAAAEFSSWLNLPGNSAEAVAICRNKALLRTMLAEAGLRQPRYAAVGDLSQVPGAVADVSLPCVVKPADDSGSNNVLLCETVEAAIAQVRVILANSLNVRNQPTLGIAVIEEYLAGPEYSIEMFSTDGAAQCVGITAKFVSEGPFFVEEGHVFPAPIPTAQADDLIAEVRAALAVAGITCGPTHTEVKLTPGGPVIVEVNPRLAGGMIPELIRLTTGVDLLDQQLLAAMGSPPHLDQPGGWAVAGIKFLTAPRQGTLAAVEDIDSARRVDGIRQLVITAAPGSVVRPPRNAYDRLGYIIAAGDTEAFVRDALLTAAGCCRLRIED